MKAIYTYIPKKNESMQLEIKRKSFHVLRDLNKTLKLKKKKKSCNVLSWVDLSNTWIKNVKSTVFGYSLFFYIAVWIKWK